MNWFNQIVNKEQVTPKEQIYVAIQDGKAMRYNDANHFAHIHKVLSFPSSELADYFISHWNPDLMFDYREAMPKQDFTFYVYDRCNGGYYADGIKMYSNWQQTMRK